MCDRVYCVALCVVEKKIHVVLKDLIKMQC